MTATERDAMRVLTALVQAHADAEVAPDVYAADPRDRFYEAIKEARALVTATQHERKLELLPVEWCTTHGDVADRGDDSCGYSLDYVQPGCVLVPCFFIKEATDG